MSESGFDQPAEHEDHTGFAAGTGSGLPLRPAGRAGRGADRELFESDADVRFYRNDAAVDSPGRPSRAAGWPLCQKA